MDMLISLITAPELVKGTDGAPGLETHERKRNGGERLRDREREREREKRLAAMRRKPAGQDERRPAG